MDLRRAFDSVSQHSIIRGHRRVQALSYIIDYVEVTLTTSSTIFYVGQEESTSICINTCSVSAFADDIVLLAEHVKDLQSSIDGAVNFFTYRAMNPAKYYALIKSKINGISHTTHQILSEHPRASSHRY